MWSRLAIRVLLLGTVTSSLAEAESYSIAYQAPNRCPQKQDFVEQVKARTSAVMLVPEPGDYRFEVRVALRTNGAAVGSLEVRTPSGKTALRTVDGERCEEVAAAMALIAALALDPNAKLDPIDTLLPPGSSTLPASPAPEAPVVDAPAPVSESPLTTNAQRNSRTRRLASSVSRPHGMVGLVSKPSQVLPSGLSVGLQVDWLSALAPNGGLPLFGGHLSWRQARALSLRLSGSLSPEQSRSADTGITVRSSYLGGRVDLGWQLLSKSPWVFDAVVTTTIGRLTSEGVVGGRVAASQQSMTTWFGAGPGFRASFQSKSGGLAIDVSVPFGIVRPLLLFDTIDRVSEEAFKASSVGIHLGVAGAWRIW